MVKRYTKNWFNSKNFERFSKELRGKKKYLEVGCFEGRSLCWMLDNVLTGDGDRAFAIDTFKGGVEHSTIKMNIDMEEIEQNYIHNVAEYGDKVVTLRGSSDLKLAELMLSHEGSFDFIYVDGSHDSWDVLVDVVICFRLLKVGGVMGLDDYRWKGMDDQLRTPRPGIDAFLYTHQYFLNLLHKDRQVWLEKTEYTHGPISSDGS